MHENLNVNMLNVYDVIFSSNNKFNYKTATKHRSACIFDVHIHVG